MTAPRIAATVSAALLALAVAAPAALAQGKAHHIVFQIDQNDPHVMNLALNNAENAAAYFKSQGDTVAIEVVAFGPGLNMYIAGKSPVADRIATMSLALDDIKFDACHNTMMKMEKQTGKPVKLISEATVVPAGVVKITELQEAGYSYIRP